MKIAYYNIGCKVNYAETAQLQKDFSAKGYKTVPFGKQCDVVVINTCTVTANADADSRKIIRRAIRDNPNAFVAVTGCYAQLWHDKIASIEGVSAIIGNDEKFFFLDKLNISKKQKEPQILISDSKEWQAHSAISVDDESHTRAVIKIQDGCDYKCSYCAVAYARGHSRSVPLDEIETLIKETIDKGFYEIVLTGINLGDWKIGEKHFIDVLKMIENLETGETRFRISSIEPNLLSDEIIDLCTNSNKICHHFHIPLQSGSPEILAEMKRRYNTIQFESRIRKIKHSIPHCCIGIDLICGFPGETEVHFRETYDLIESLPVSYLHSFTYSERKGTPAFDMKDTVLMIERKKRTEKLRQLSEKKRETFYRSQIGKICRVIPETYTERLARWQGWTDNYIKVRFSAQVDLKSFPIEVIIEDYEDNTAIGKLISNNGK